MTGLERDDYVVPLLPTQLHMVEILSNLEATRERLQLAETARTLEQAVEVMMQKRTDLRLIRAQGGNAETSAAIANTLRDVFLADQVHLRRAETGKHLRDLEARLPPVRRQLQAADAELQAFVEQHKVIGLDPATQARL